MPREELFDLARSIDAHKDSMAQSREEAVAGVMSGLISLGQEVTWRALAFRCAHSNDEPDHRNASALLLCR
jgi:hypothetical protein